MNDDFESRFARLLNEQVDVRLGARQAAPPFDPARPVRVEGNPRRGPWLLPLIAAAVVAGVVGATVTATHLLSDGRPAAPATRPPSTAPVTQAAPSNATSPATSKTKSATGVHTVSLGPAKITLPAGWVARDLREYSPNGGSFVAPGWCLTPADVAVSTKDNACPMFFWVVPPGAANAQLDVDIQGGFASNPEYCLQGTKLARMTEQTGDKDFGGRSADWRRWTIACKGGPTYDIEQYVVATDPAYVLFDTQPDSRYHQAMAEIATHSQLPPQGRPLRLMDRGIIRSIVRTADGYRIGLDRIVRRFDGTTNENPATYDYPLSAAIMDADRRSNRIEVGTAVHLATDGYAVLYVEPS